MCGRFAFYSPAEATAALFGAKDAAAVEPRYNIAPTRYVAAVRDTGSDGRELAMLRWGLVPSWARDPAIGNRMINARAETIAEKPSFRSAYRKRRCLVLADGFYEWHSEGEAKVPYYISMADGTPFAFAAIWETWLSRETGESMQTTALVTTSASTFLARVHHRMPIMLVPGAADAWLAGGDESLARFPDAAPAVRAWPVDRRVNNARNESPDLIEPAGPALA